MLRVHVHVDLVELEHVPIRASIRITQYNLFETEVTTFETTSIGTDGKPILGYREKYGIHGEEILIQFDHQSGLIFMFKEMLLPLFLT